MKLTGKRIMAIGAAGMVMAGVMSTTVMANAVSRSEYCTEESLFHGNSRCDNMKERCENTAERHHQHSTDEGKYENHYENHHESHHGR